VAKDVLFQAGVQTINGYTVILPELVKAEDMLNTMPPNPYAEDQYKKFPLGTLAMKGSRWYRYCKNGSSGLNIAAPIQSAAAAHDEQDDDIVVGAAAAIGATEVVLTSTANLDTAPNDVKDDFAGGFLIVNDEAGEGQLYEILSNDLLTGTDDSTFKLVDALTIALTTSSQVGIIRNPYYRVIATTAVVTGKVIGVPIIAVTASYYFWCQTKGPAAVVPQAAIALGTMAVVGTTAAKADPAAAATTEIPIGEPLTPGIADTESMIVWLQCE